jgi:hypothetical protein
MIKEASFILACFVVSAGLFVLFTWLFGGIGVFLWFNVIWIIMVYFTIT